MDIELPGIDGIEVTRILRNKSGFKDIPIIAITAYVMSRDKQYFLSSGFDAYMSKPIDIDIIRKLLKDYK